MDDTEFFQNLFQAVHESENQSVQLLMIRIQTLAWANSTLNSYLQVAKKFVDFIETNDCDPNCITEEVISVFLVRLAQSELKISTISTLLSNLKGFYKFLHAKFPEQSYLDITIKGLSRVCDTSVRRAEPVLSSHLAILEVCFTGIQLNSAAASYMRSILSDNKLRIMVMFTMAHDGLLRVSELLGLKWSDIMHTELGFVISIGHSKTNQSGPPETVSIIDHEAGYTSASTWLNIYEGKYAKDPDALMFPCLKKRQTSISTREFNKWVKLYAVQMQLDPKAVSSHSFRSGGATDMVLRGATREMVMRQGRWKSIEMVEIYFRPSTSAWQSFLRQNGTTRGTLQGGL